MQQKSFGKLPPVSVLTLGGGGLGIYVRFGFANNDIYQIQAGAGNNVFNIGAAAGAVRHCRSACRCRSRRRRS